MKESTSYECYTYIESGQADDYKAQMEERFSLLRNPELKNVELPAMNSDQGPLMHMEVMEDPYECYTYIESGQADDYKAQL